jgi:Fe-S-cluster containining protein
MAVFCLSVHARYACAHRGACCTAGWPIPVEPRVVAGLAANGIRVTPVLETDSQGTCTFFERESHLCAIHRQAGPELLPSACRHFPRVVLDDPRGTFVTLSHFCPTAARLLLQARGVRRIEAPAPLSLDGTAEGLDATAVMPPLLRPGLLTDLAGYDAWECAGLAALDETPGGVDEALRVIGAATGEVSGWRPGGDPLSARVRIAFARARPSRAPSAEEPLERPIRAFIAAHLFGNWVAYQGTGLVAVVEHLHDVLARLRQELAAHGDFVEAVRATDLRFRHAA